jgi:hypothetical protein
VISHRICSATVICLALVLFTASPSAEAAASHWSSAAAHVSHKSANLMDVDCPRLKMCIAVGNIGPKTRALVMRWNGKSWKRDRSLKHRFDQLASVSCPTTNFCVTVPYIPWIQRGIGIEHWNGHSWVRHSFPGAGQLDRLRSVSCTSSTSCVAVGFDYSTNPESSLVLHWDGHTWSRLAPPQVGTDSNTLNGVECLSASDCWMVGGGDVNDFSRSLILHWNGSTFAVTPTPLVTKDDVLLNVSCVSSNHCYAVGSAHSLTSGKTKQLGLSLSNGSWKVAFESKRQGTLNDVSCTRSGRCYATAFRANGVTDFTGVARVLRFGGAHVVQEKVPSPGGRNGASYLNGISCPKKSKCRAVGYYRTTWTTYHTTPFYLRRHS